MTNVYRIGVSLAMVNGVSPVLGVIARDLLGLHGGIGKLEKGFGRIKLAVGGVAAAMAGLALAGAFKAPLEEAVKYQTVLAQFKGFGMSDAINTAADKYARSARVMGSSARDMMTYMVEAQGIFRESGQMTEAQALMGSKIAAPILAKINFANMALNPEKAGALHTQDLQMLRFIESRGGANDPTTFAHLADWGYKLIKSSGTNINWDQLRSLVKTAGAGGFNLTDDALSKLEPVITDLGGGAVGSGQRTAFQRLIGTQRMLPKQAIQEYLSLGLWDRTKVELSKTGGINRFVGRPGAVLNNREQFASDPIGYYMERFLPAISKKYGEQILGDTVGAKVQRAAEISMVFGPGTAGSLFSQIDKQMPAIMRSIAAQAKAFGIDADDKNASATMAGKRLMMQKNMETLQLLIGEKVLPMAITGITMVNGALESLTSWAGHHPNQLAAFVQGALAISAGLVVFGGMAVIIAAGAAIFAGGAAAVWVVGVAAVATIFGALAAMNWHAISSGMHEFRDAMLFFIKHPLQFMTTPLKDLGAAVHKFAESDAEFKERSSQVPIQAAPHAANSNVPPRMAPTKMSYVTGVYIDGRLAGHAIIPHIADAIDRQSSAGGGGFDPTMSLSPIGLSAA